MYIYIPRTLRPSTAGGGAHCRSGGKRTVGAGSGRWRSRCCPPDWRSDRHSSEGPESSESSGLTCTRPGVDVRHRRLRFRACCRLRVHGHRRLRVLCVISASTRRGRACPGAQRNKKQTQCARVQTAAGSREQPRGHTACRDCCYSPRCYSSRCCYSCQCCSSLARSMY